MATAERRESADVIVVGASVGGLVAAILAADKGCHVMVIERTKELGGGVAWAPESIAAAGTRFQREAGVDDRAERLAADLAGAGAEPGETELLQALAAQSATLVEWLVDRCGAPVHLLPREPDAGHGVARVHAFEPQGGASLLAAVSRVVTRHHRIRLRTATEVLELVRDPSGRVTGIGLKPDRRGTPQLHGAVVLACGGFAADDALIAEHCPEAAGLPWVGPALATGDGLRLAGALGASGRRLSACELLPFLAQPAHLPVPVRVAHLGAVLVNQAGRRFVDETGDPVGLARQVQAQPGRVAYLVLDDRVLAGAASDPFFEHVVRPRAARRAESIAALAKQFELDPETLAATVDAWNGGSAADATGRRRTTEPLTPPFHGIRITSARWRTLGGLAVDAHARILDAAGSPLPGLWAAGGVAAAPAGASRLAGTAALANLVLGRLAALDVVASLQSEPAPPAPETPPQS